MTIQGAIEDLNNLINAKDIPVYYKPSLEKIKETIELENQNTLQAELEEIRTEISKIKIKEPFILRTPEDIQYEAILILDKHIKELNNDNI